MQAIQPVIPPQNSAVSVRPISRRRRPKAHRRSYEAIVWETSVKLVVNLLLSSCAISALLQLIPHQQETQEKLRDLEVEVKLTQERVQKAKMDFSRYFDPSQSPSLMQEYSNRVDPQKRQIIWVEPAPPESGEDEPSPSEP